MFVSQEVRAATVSRFMQMLCFHRWWGRWGLQQWREQIFPHLLHVCLQVCKFPVLADEDEEELNPSTLGWAGWVRTFRRSAEEEDAPLLSLWYSGQIQKTALHPSPSSLFRSHLCSHWLHRPYFQISEMKRKTQSQHSIYLFLNTNSSMAIL